VSVTPWYHEGLRFQCSGCGNCCTGAPGYVWVNQEEIETLAAAIGVEHEQFIENYTRQVGDGTSLMEFANGDCVLFDQVTRRCKVYLHRPRQCRTWPFWESTLASEADWTWTGRGCAGIGQGPLVPLEEIEAQARVIRV
jgi:Fe-S-cluster containining protein